jgi:16S rRNA (guanine527-N7)-methyltransferase
VLVAAAPGRAVDLGSGGGVPGLVLACHWPDSQWLLLDASHRRTDFLTDAVTSLGLNDRVRILCQRAEEAGRLPDLRHSADLVTARGFARPAVTAECAAPLLVVGGLLVVSDPPDAVPDRWPPEPLESLGLVPDGVSATAPALQRLRQVTPCPDRYPRRTGVPAKRPLF